MRDSIIYRLHRSKAFKSTVEKAVCIRGAFALRSRGYSHGRRHLRYDRWIFLVAQVRNTSFGPFFVAFSSDNGWASWTLLELFG